MGCEAAQILRDEKLAHKFLFSFELMTSGAARKKHGKNDVTLMTSYYQPVAIGRVLLRLEAKYFCVPPTKAFRF